MLGIRVSGGLASLFGIVPGFLPALNNGFGRLKGAWARLADGQTRTEHKDGSG
jgi:hypothetical protein